MSKKKKKIGGQLVRTIKKKCGSFSEAFIKRASFSEALNLSAKWVFSFSI